MRTSFKILCCLAVLIFCASSLEQVRAQTQPQAPKGKPAAAKPGKAESPDKNVLARVGNKVITLSEFNKIIGYYEPEQRKMIEKNPQAKPTILWQTVQGMVLADLARQKGFRQEAGYPGTASTHLQQLPGFSVPAAGSSQ